MDKFCNIEFYNTPEGDVMVKEVGQAATIYPSLPLFGIEKTSKPAWDYMIYPK